MDTLGRIAQASVFLSSNSSFYDCDISWYITSELGGADMLTFDKLRSPGFSDVNMLALPR